MRRWSIGHRPPPVASARCLTSRPGGYGDSPRSSRRATPEGTEAFRAVLLEEVDHALRPPVHERRVVSSGTILEPRSDPATWAAGDAARHHPRRRSISSRFGRPAASPTGCRAGSCAARTARTSGWSSTARPARSGTSWCWPSVLEATIVQRHPAGSVRVVGELRRAPLGGLQLAPRAAGQQLDRRRDRVLGPRRPRGARGDARVRDPRPRIAAASARCSSIDPMPSPVPRSRSGCRHRRRSESAVPRISRRSAMPSPRSTAPPSSTPTGCCAGSACGWCRARRPKTTVEPLRRHAPHVRPPLQPRRPARHRDRGERGRSGLRASQRRGARPLARRRLTLARPTPFFEARTSL